MAKTITRTFKSTYAQVEGFNRIENKPEERSDRLFEDIKNEFDILAHFTTPQFIAYKVIHSKTEEELREMDSDYFYAHSRPCTRKQKTDEIEE